MGTTHIAVESNVPGDAFISALTDFSPRRSEVFGNSEGGYLKVHEQGDTWADVTEGSHVAGGIWQRYRYDWSEPGRIHLEVLDSNLFGNGSWWDYRTSKHDSRTVIDLTVHRVPSNLKARLLDLVLRVYGPIFHKRDLQHTLKKIESAL